MIKESPEIEVAAVYVRRLLNVTTSGRKAVLEFSEILQDYAKMCVRRALTIDHYENWVRVRWADDSNPPDIENAMKEKDAEDMIDTFANSIVPPLQEKV